ncbi:HAD domain-containing protein [Clostridium sp. YIM B02551]|uniref:HAD domain-containing protein n=1 Tax=Clostridium sp. YIM B02551 TaxID=2910679 RepID=UPI001EEAE025|nr:HAD domain-containing protein [Clostridium sp. YIM B02551]
MKVIFLDIDGVLNSEEFFLNNKNQVIDKNCVSILKNIVDTTGAVIVMSSGWKLWFDDDMMPQDDYSKSLYEILCEFDIKLFGKTPDFSNEEIITRKTFSHVKAKEIKVWLNEHEDIDKYVVIDDLDMKDEEINTHLVRINGKTGITEEYAKAVIDMIK